LLRHHRRRRCVPLMSNVRPIGMQVRFASLRCCIRSLARAVRLRGRRTSRCSRTSSSSTSARAVRPAAASEPLVVLAQRCALGSSSAVSSLRQSTNTVNRWSQSGSAIPRLSVVSLGVRGPAAPDRGCTGIGFTRAVSVGAFGHQWKCKLAAVRHRASSPTGAAVPAPSTMSVARDRLASSSVRPNHSVERTHNGGARLFAPSATAAPLCAAHVKR